MAAERNEKRELGEINKRNFLYIFSHSEPYTGNWRPAQLSSGPYLDVISSFFSFERGKKR